MNQDNNYILQWQYNNATSTAKQIPCFKYTKDFAIRIRDVHVLSLLWNTLLGGGGEGRKKHGYKSLENL